MARGCDDSVFLCLFRIFTRGSLVYMTFHETTQHNILQMTTRHSPTQHVTRTQHGTRGRNTTQHSNMPAIAVTIDVIIMIITAGVRKRKKASPGGPLISLALDAWRLRCFPLAPLATFTSLHAISR